MSGMLFVIFCVICGLVYSKARRNRPHCRMCKKQKWLRDMVYHEPHRLPICKRCYRKGFLSYLED